MFWDCTMITTHHPQGWKHIQGQFCLNCATKTSAWQQLRLRQCAFLTESAQKILTVRWQCFAYALRGSRMPMQQSALCAVRKALIHCDVLNHHDLGRSGNIHQSWTAKHMRSILTLEERQHRQTYTYIFQTLTRIICGRAAIGAFVSIE